MPRPVFFIRPYIFVVPGVFVNEIKKRCFAALNKTKKRAQHSDTVSQSKRVPVILNAFCYSKLFLLFRVPIVIPNNVRDPSLRSG